MAEEPRTTGEDAFASALSELAECENAPQVSSWAARWLARSAAATIVLVWTPDPSDRFFVCTGLSGEGARAFSRRSIPRDDPVARDRVRDRTPLALSSSEYGTIASEWSAGAPESAQWCVVLPVGRTGAPPAAIASLFFASRPDPDAVVRRVQTASRLASPALERALRMERRTAGMLHAIERLTALYDLSKAFGSTIDWNELTAIMVRKAVDFSGAEAGSLWLLDADSDSVTLGATAVNESYEIASTPEAVGASVVGDVLAERSALLRNGLAPDEGEVDGGEFPCRSLLAVPLLEDDAPIGALVVVNKRGRVPEFTEQDQELLEDLAKQAVRALHHVRQYEAERKVEELDALLAVSRQITATLDLDKVMQAVVNATSALVTYDRCAVAILDRGRLRLGAVSGMAELDRSDPGVRRTEELLQWVFLSGKDVSVAARDDGTVAADRPETEEKFRAHFQEAGLKSFYAALLRDEEGKLGVLGFECKEPLEFDEETRDLLQILVNQATVAVRNAQLYRQVPLAGFLKPLAEGRRRLSQLPRRRRMAWAIGGLVLLAFLLVPWRLRIGGPTRLQPGRQSVVTAGVEGVVSSVAHREGDRVEPGEVIATLQDESYRAALADATSAVRIADGEIARYQEAGAAGQMYDAQSRRQELAAKVAMEQDRLARTRLTAAVGGVIVTPHLEERVGQNLARGAEFCVVADVGRVVAEVAVPEGDAAYLRAGQPAAVKVNPFPSRTFEGRVERVGARIREEGGVRFVVAEVTLANADGALKTGMVGRGKITVGRHPIAVLLLRRPARWLYSRLWPLIP